MLITKEKKEMSSFPADHRVKLKERKKKKKYLDFCWELQKTVEHAAGDATNCT